MNTFSHFNKSISCCKAAYAASTANYIGKAKLIEYIFGQNELFAGIESVEAAAGQATTFAVRYALCEN